MTCRLFLAFTDGSEIEEEYPNHEIDNLQELVVNATKELFVAIELEDHKETIIYLYKKETTYVY